MSWGTYSPKADLRRCPDLPVDGYGKGEWCRNGEILSVDQLRHLREYMTALAYRRRQVLFSHALRLADFTAATGSTNSLECVFKTSRTEHPRIRVRHLVYPDGGAATTDESKIRWEVTPYPVAGGTTINQPYLVVDPVYPTSGSAEEPDAHSVIEQTWDNLQPDTLYQAKLVIEDYARILAVTIYEENRFWVVTESVRPKRGSGDSFAISGSTVTLTDAAASFDSDDVNRNITILGATSRGNNGTFPIVSAPSGTTLTYVNDDGATEALPSGGQWFIGPSAPNPSSFVAGADVTASDVSSLIDSAKIMYKRNGGPLAHWSVIDQGSPQALTTAAWLNAFDGSAGGGASESIPGFWLWTEGCGDISTDTVHCLVWYIADKSSNTGSVRFWDPINSTAYATTVINSATKGLYLAEIDLPSDSANSPLFLSLEGYAGAAGTLSIYGAGILQWEA